jgi:hypothetical protein
MLFPTCTWPGHEILSKLLKTSGVDLYKITSRQDFTVVNIFLLIATRVKVGENYTPNTLCVVLYKNEVVCCVLQVLVA